MLSRKDIFDFNENKNQTSLCTFESLFEVSGWRTFFLYFWRIFQNLKKLENSPKILKNFPQLESSKSDSNVPKEDWFLFSSKL